MIVWLYLSSGVKWNSTGWLSYEREKTGNNNWFQLGVAYWSNFNQNQYPIFGWSFSVLKILQDFWKYGIFLCCKINGKTRCPTFLNWHISDVWYFQVNHFYVLKLCGWYSRWNNVDHYRETAVPSLILMISRLQNKFPRAGHTLCMNLF